MNVDFHIFNALKFSYSLHSFTDKINQNKICDKFDFFIRWMVKRILRTEAHLVHICTHYICTFHPSFFFYFNTLAKGKNPIIYYMHGMVETEKDGLSLDERLKTHIQYVHQDAMWNRYGPSKNIGSIILAHY
jgi:hypothetical protein